MVVIWPLCTPVRIQHSWSEGLNMLKTLHNTWGECNRVAFIKAHQWRLLDDDRFEGDGDRWWEQPERCWRCLPPVYKPGYCLGHSCMLVHLQQGFPYVCCRHSQHLVMRGVVILTAASPLCWRHRSHLTCLRRRCKLVHTGWFFLLQSVMVWISWHTYSIVSHFSWNDVVSSV